MQVLVLGYYGRKNLGDDVFEVVFSNYLKSRNFVPEIKNIDEVTSIPDDVGCIIFGGGDLINDYYINKMKLLINNSPIYLKKKIPIYALGVGIPYPSLIDKGYLDLFDYIVSRSKKDKLEMNKRFSPNSTSNTTRYSYAPDFSFLLNEYNEVGGSKEFSNSLNKVEKNAIKEPTKKIGVFLSQTIYSTKAPEAYDIICKGLVDFFTFLLSKEKRVFKFRKGLVRVPEYELHLYPCCTEDKYQHDDRVINRHIYSSLKHFENIKIFENAIPVSQISSLFSSFDFTICTRFHAHMFSIIAKVPFLSISTSSKVENILHETGNTNLHVRMEVDPCFSYPISLDVSECLNKFKYLEEHYSRIKTSLEESHENYLCKINKFTKKLDNLLSEMPIYPLNHLNYLAYDKSKTIAKTLYSHYIADNFYLDDKEKEEVSFLHNLIHEKGSISKYLSFLSKNNIVELISYILTGNRKSSYNYGLCEQIFSPHYCLWDSIHWIINHMYQDIMGININLNNNIPFNQRKIKVNFGENFKGYHRSGWNYVVSNLEKYHHENGIIFDTYLDRTFGWDNDFLSFAKVVPYTSPWVGIFHHTNNPNYSPYDLSNCLSNINFIESLPYCKGIIILSKQNKKYLTSELKNLGFDIPVLKLIHPTELQGFETFNLNTFEMGPIKNIVQVGAWLRNTYAIYDLKVPDNYSKIALKGKNMDNYFLKDTEWKRIIKKIEKIKGKDNASGSIIEGSYTNKYIRGLIDSIQLERDSVTVISELDNFAYDSILKSNIIFINLIDAAAVNTIIECIVRHTPIVVNRLPATEEYLGKDYPLFYEKLEDVSKLIGEPRNIRNAHRYLKLLDKNRFSIEYFLSQLLNSSLYCNL